LSVEPIGAGSPDSIDAGLKHVYGGACRLEGEIQVSLVHKDGTVATEIGGNPASIPIDATLGVGETGDASWGWSGCLHGTFFAVVSGPDGLNGRTRAEPYCQEGRVPNRLYPGSTPFKGSNSDQTYRTALRALNP
jgi:hypothetical protein